MGSAAAASAGECHPFLLRGGGQLSHHRHHRSQGHLVSRTGNSDDILNSDDTAAVDKQIQELMSVIVSQGKAICDQLQKLNDSKSAAGSSSNLDTSVDRGSQSESRSESRQSSETRSTRKQQKVKSSRDHHQRAPKRDAGHHPDHLLVASDLPPPTTSPSNSSQLPSAPITTSSPVSNGIGANANVRASASAIGSASAEEAKYQRDMLILQTIHSELVKLSAMNDKLVFAEDSVDRLQISLKQQTESESITNPPLSTDQLRVSEEQVGTMPLLTRFVVFFHMELGLLYVFYHNDPSSHILTP